MGVGVVITRFKANSVQLDWTSQLGLRVAIFGHSYLEGQVNNSIIILKIIGVKRKY